MKDTKQDVDLKQKNKENQICLTSMLPSRYQNSSFKNLSRVQEFDPEKTPTKTFVRTFQITNYLPKKITAITATQNLDKVYFIEKAAGISFKRKHLFHYDTKFSLKGAYGITRKRNDVDTNTIFDLKIEDFLFMAVKTSKGFHDIRVVSKKPVNTITFSFERRYQGESWPEDPYCDRVSVRKETTYALFDFRSGHFDHLEWMTYNRDIELRQKAKKILEF